MLVPVSNPRELYFSGRGMHFDGVEAHCCCYYCYGIIIIIIIIIIIMITATGDKLTLLICLFRPQIASQVFAPGGSALERGQW